MATWQAPPSRSRSRGSSSIGVLRSASVKRRCSPRARSIPARTAAPLPWLRPSATHGELRPAARQPTRRRRRCRRCCRRRRRSPRTPPPTPSRYSRTRAERRGDALALVEGGDDDADHRRASRRSSHQNWGSTSCRRHRLGSRASRHSHSSPARRTGAGARRAVAGQVVEGAADADAHPSAHGAEVVAQEALLAPRAVGGGDQGGGRLADALRGRRGGVTAVGDDVDAGEGDARRTRGGPLGHPLARAHQRDAVSERAEREAGTPREGRRRRRARRGDSPRRRSARTRPMPSGTMSAAASSSACEVRLATGAHEDLGVEGDHHRRSSGTPAPRTGRPAAAPRRPCPPRRPGNRGRARAS